MKSATEGDWSAIWFQWFKWFRDPSSGLALPKLSKYKLCNGPDLAPNTKQKIRPAEESTGKRWGAPRSTGEQVLISSLGSSNYDLSSIRMANQKVSDSQFSLRPGYMERVIMSILFMAQNNNFQYSGRRADDGTTNCAEHSMRLASFWYFKTPHSWIVSE